MIVFYSFLQTLSAIDVSVFAQHLFSTPRTKAILSLSYGKLVEMKRVAFQSLDIEYPPKAYTFAAWALQNEVHYPVPMRGVYTNLDEMEKDANKVIGNLIEYPDKKSYIYDTILVLGLKYMEPVPLYRKYWMGKTESKTTEIFTSFMLGFPDFRKLKALIIPIINNSKVDLSVGMFFTNPTKAALEKYMASSDQFVSPEAKNAALYTIEDVYGYDLKTKNVVKKSFLGNTLN